MQTSNPSKASKFIRVLPYLVLIPLAWLAYFSYDFYRFLVIYIGILVVRRLISRLRRSRHSALRYRWGAFIGVVILWVAFTVSPGFNFLLTFPVRQRTVTHFLETHKLPQSDPIKTVLLGKATDEVGLNSGDVTVYFCLYRSGSKLGDRALILFTTDPVQISQMETIIYFVPSRAKKLKENWFFIHLPILS